MRNLRPIAMSALLASTLASTVFAQTSPQPSEEYGEEVDAPPFAPGEPPVLPPETRPAPPYDGAVWTKGHWFWDGSQWRNKPGAWVAPMPGYHFINGYWQPANGGWQWISGGWAPAGSSLVEIPIEATDEQLAADEAPPPPQEEMQPLAPDVYSVWTPGYWYWSGASYAWVGGAWLIPPRPDYAFITPCWVRRGPSWYFSSGGWAPRGSLHVAVPVYRHAGIEVGWGHPNYYAHTWQHAPAFHRYSPEHVVYNRGVYRPLPGRTVPARVERGHDHRH